MKKQAAPAKKPTTRPRGVTVYAVQRCVWGGEGLTEGDPERVFADEKSARNYVAERTKAARPFTNPFSLSYGVPISGGEKKFIALVKKLKLTPPIRKKDEYSTNWVAWWDTSYPNMTDAQRDAIWKALDRLELYHIVKTTLEE